MATEPTFPRMEDRDDDLSWFLMSRLEAQIEAIVAESHRLASLAESKRRQQSRKEYVARQRESAQRQQPSAPPLNHLRLVTDD
ncbi:MAG: hypothetical protein VYA80_06810 [Pseudomonadota bacterium]|nr:hypothetical protein [Pseudomonadota bacterium]